MNILFVSAVLPYPLYSGGQIRIYNLLQKLSRTHQISLFSFIRSESERQYRKDLSFLHDVTMINRGKGVQAKYLVRSLCGKYPLLLTTYDIASMRHALSVNIASHSYDLVHIEPFYVFPSLPDIGRLPLIVSEHNVEYDVYSSFAKRSPNLLLKPFYHLEADRIRDWEIRILSKASRITAVSQEDATIIKNVSGNRFVSIVPNGVDTDSFAFHTKSFDGKQKRFLFVGDFAWLPNRDMLDTLLKTVWPAIKARLPDSELRVVGKHLPQSYKKQNIPGVLFDEHVSDIRASYREADALLAPVSIAGGTKFKMLEAMATGCPIITTPEGMYGISGESGVHASIVDSTEGFVQFAVDLYANPKHWQRMCRRARTLVEGSYSWTAIAARLQRVWEGVGHDIN